LQRAKEGKVDILIGTHRLLSPDVAWSNLGLILVDEEQRFGVKAKEAIKRWKGDVDVMTLTATPIRTGGCCGCRSRAGGSGRSTSRREAQAQSGSRPKNTGWAGFAAGWIGLSRRPCRRSSAAI
jgi:hypothetical protein